MNGLVGFLILSLKRVGEGVHSDKNPGESPHDKGV